MRVTTAFNRMLAISGASVASVTFASEGIVVGLRRRRSKHRCPCGWRTWSTYDHSIRRWRHLDLGSTRCFLEAGICRIDCARCGRVRTEEVPFPRDADLAGQHAPQHTAVDQQDEDAESHLSPVAVDEAAHCEVDDPAEDQR